MNKNHSDLCGYNEVVLVGNGPSALDLDIGEVIDNFKWVTRFNSFKISGYEKQVRTKVDIQVSCNSNEKNNLLPLKRIYYATQGINRENKGECIGYKKLKVIRSDHKRVFQIPYWVWWELRAKFFSRKPSIGAAISYYFSHIFSKVYIYGFDYLAHEKPHHYFGKNKTAGWHHHSPVDEANYFNKMIEEERLFLLKEKIYRKVPVKWK